MLFMFVSNLYLAMVKRFSGYLRVICAFLALVAVMGIVVSGDRTVLILFLLFSVLVPWITVERWKFKLKRAAWLMLALLGFAGLLWLTADLYTVRPRLHDLITGDPLPERSVSEGIGLRMLAAALFPDRE